MYQQVTNLLIILFCFYQLVLGKISEEERTVYVSMLALFANPLARLNEAKKGD